MAITTIADYSYLSDVYNSAPLPYPQINIPVSLDAGCTMEIQNYSPFVLQIYSGKTLIESLPPYSWLICNYTDKATANIVSPASLPLAAGAFISTNVMPQKLARLRGDFTLPLAQTVNTPVITPTGQTLAVAGSLNVANVVSATITQAAGTSLSIGTVQSIVENVTTSSTVTNAYISDNSLVYFGQQSVGVTNLASGSQQTVPDIVMPTGGFFDGILVFLESSNGVNGQYQLVKNGILFNDMKGTNSYLFNESTTFSTANVTYSGGSGLGYSTIIFPEPVIFSDVALYLKNITTGTITSDTVTVTVYAIRSQVTINNTSMSPVQSQTSYQMTQTALGTYNLSGTSFTGIIDLQTTPTFATDNLKTMHVMISVTNASGLSSTCTVDIKLESAMSSGGMLYDVGSTNTYPTVFSISGNTNVTWDNAVTPQMSSAYPYLAFEVYLNNTSGTATTASATVAITVMVNS